MEFPFRSRPTTAAADDEENGRPRRFPDPAPPQRHCHGEASTSEVDTALLTRKQELLLELHKGLMHQDMILRELMETERAIGLTTGSHNPVPALSWSQDYWRRRTPSMPPWEVPLHQPCPCGGGSSTAIRAPPVYPHVERSPSPPPLLQLQSASDTEKQQHSRSSGARTHPTSGHVELCSSPSKCAPEEETLVPVAPNTSVRSTRSGSIHEEVASTHQKANDSWERKGVAEACHGVQQHMYEGRNQKSEGRDAAKFAKDDECDEAMQLPYRYSLAGSENTGSYQQKRLQLSEVASLRSGSIHEVVESTQQKADDSWERKGGVEACHGVQHMNEGRNQKSEGRDADKFPKDDQSNEAMQLPYRYSLAGNENAGSYQQKRLQLSEPAPEQTRPSNDAEQHQEGKSSGLRTHPFRGYEELCRSPSKLTPVEENVVPVEAKTGINQMSSVSIFEEAASRHKQVVVGIKVDVEDGRSMQPLHEIKNKSSEEGKAIDSAIKDCIKKPVQQRLQYKPADQENAANSERKCTEFNEAAPERTAGVKRKLTAPSSPVKKLGQLSCTVCQSYPTTQDQLDQHLAGKRHRLNVAALQTSRSKSNSPEPNTRATPVRSRAITTNANHQDGKEEVPENTWTCTLCQAKCTNELDYYIHLGGRRHRENEEARQAKLSRTYCTLCDVQCNSEKNLESHLGGRRHREALQSRN